MSASDLLRQWHTHLSNERRHSPHTVRAYHRAAERLVLAKGLEAWEHVAALDALALRRHLASRRAEGLANTSAARELSALKSFIAYARSETGEDSILVYNKSPTMPI